MRDDGAAIRQEKSRPRNSGSGPVTKRRSFRTDNFDSTVFSRRTGARRPFGPPHSGLLPLNTDLGPIHPYGHAGTVNPYGNVRNASTAAETSAKFAVWFGVLG